MSILNAFITPELGLIGVDTEGAMPDGSFVDGCKMIALPHISAVIGFRGIDHVFISASPSFVGFKGALENLIDLLPDILKGSIQCAREHFRSPEEHLGTEMVLVGYSQAKGEVVGHSIEQKVGASSAQCTLIPGHYIAPCWGREDIPKGIRQDREGMITLAQHQSRRSRELKPEAAAGGRFFIAEIQQHSISIAQAFEFPPRPRANEEAI